QGLQRSTQTKVLLVEGREYLESVCDGNMETAVQALQSCSIAGVLQWYYEPGTVESENTKILRRSLTYQNTSEILLVGVPEVCISSRSRTSSLRQSLAFAVHNTLGFVVVSPSSSVLQGSDGEVGQILLFGARSTHVRGLDELLSVVKEGGNSVICFSIWDTKIKAPLTIDHISDIQQISHISTPIFPYSEYPSNTSHQYIHPPTTRSVRIHGEELQAKDFPIRRFLLTSKLQQVPFMCPVFVEAPSRLLLGAAMRLLQDLGRVAVLLELALPVNGPVLRPGQGRHVHRVLAPQPLMIPCSTANVSAYKTYRAFGFGESAALLPLRLNAHREYLYPVMITGCGLLTKEQVKSVVTRSVASLKGLQGWSKKPPPAETSEETKRLLESVAREEKEKTRIVEELLKSGTKKSPRVPERTSEKEMYIKELGLFEYMIDRISASQPQCEIPKSIL
ncbi:MAG: hypothetical protein EBZ48_16275, partial [Proteobacteria bacterium]|nr:hypothetical protein [Pseudomonadota bacterium]